MAEIVSGGLSADAARAAVAAGSWRASWLRVFLAILVGAPLGGLLTLLLSVAASLSGRGALPSGLVSAGFGLSLIWLVLIGLGAIPWAILHRAGRRGWLSALAVGSLGFGLIGVVGTIWILMARVSRGGTDFSVLVAVMTTGIIGAACAFIGSVIALVMWRIAYRRGPSTDVAAVFT